MYYASNHMFVVIRCSLHDIGKMIKTVQYLPNLFFFVLVYPSRSNLSCCYKRVMGRICK